MAKAPNPAQISVTLHAAIVIVDLEALADRIDAMMVKADLGDRANSFNEGLGAASDEVRKLARGK